MFHACSMMVTIRKRQKWFPHHSFNDVPTGKRYSTPETVLKSGDSGFLFVNAFRAYHPWIQLVMNRFDAVNGGEISRRASNDGREYDSYSVAFFWDDSSSMAPDRAELLKCPGPLECRASIEKL